MIEDMSLKLVKQNYLLFILHKKGFPVEDLYNKKVKDKDDQFFQNMTDIRTEHVQESPKNESFDKTIESFMNFDPEASYESFHLPKPESPSWPKEVDKLDFKKLELYKKKQNLINKKFAK